MILAAALALAGCAATAPPEPKVVTQTVNIPVLVPCWTKVAKPAFVGTPEALKAAPNTFEWAKLIVSDRLQAHGLCRRPLESAAGLYRDPEVLPVLRVGGPGQDGLPLG